METMYTFAMEVCSLVFIFGVLAVILENVLTYVVYDGREEDETEEF